VTPLRNPGDPAKLLFQHIKSLNVADAKDIYMLRRNTDERFFSSKLNEKKVCS